MFLSLNIFMQACRFIALLLWPDFCLESFAQALKSSARSVNCSPRSRLHSLSALHSLSRCSQVCFYLMHRRCPLLSSSLISPTDLSPPDTSVSFLFRYALMPDGSTAFHLLLPVAEFLSYEFRFNRLQMHGHVSVGLHNVHSSSPYTPYLSVHRSGISLCGPRWFMMCASHCVRIPYHHLPCMAHFLSLCAGNERYCLASHDARMIETR